jgi:Zn-dependent protease with chaperone function
MQFIPRRPDRNVNVTPTSAIREFLVFAGGLMAIVLILYLLLGFAVEILIPHLSPGLEQALAVNLLPRIMNKEADGRKNKEIQILLDRLQEHCAKIPYHCTVTVIDSPRVNALAAPGGTIIIFSGLLDRLSSENELAFVLGHEMGHFSHRDHLRGLGRGLVFTVISTALFGPHNQVSRMAARLLNLTELSFSRRQETAADHFALDVLHCVYGHVGGALNFFKKLASIDHSRYAGISFFSSHPLFPERMRNLRNYCRQQGFDNGRLTPLPEEL